MSIGIRYIFPAVTHENAKFILGDSRHLFGTITVDGGLTQGIPSDIITLQKIDWPKGDAEHEQRTCALYDDLSDELRKVGIYPYRLGTHKQAAAQHLNGGGTTFE